MITKKKELVLTRVDYRTLDEKIARLDRLGVKVSKTTGKNLNIGTVLGMIKDFYPNARIL